MKVSATPNDWREIIYCGLENQQIDFKSPQDWVKIGRSGRAKFARHAIALANTNGGYVVVGVAEDSDGNPINVLPKFLFVPSCLDALANELVISPTVTGGSTTTAAFNVLSKYGLEVVSSPYLQIGVGGQAGSATGWYLFGDPAQIDTFEIGYLQGRRVPVVEQGEVNFNTLGMGFRVVFDLGIKEQAYQGMTFNTGVV